jgi:AcrR family transcriptional regulator
MLREALVALILERGWDATSVREVCARADVGRSTFYAHFADKEELLLSGFDGLRLELAASGPEPFAFVEKLLEHAEGHRRLYRALLGKRAALAVQQRFRELLLEMVERSLSALREDRRGTATHALTGALFELVRWWLDGRSGLTTEALVAQFKLVAEAVSRIAMPVPPAPGPSGPRP